MKTVFLIVRKYDGIGKKNVQYYDDDAGTFRDYIHLATRYTTYQKAEGMLTYILQNSNSLLDGIYQIEKVFIKE